MDLQTIGIIQASQTRTGQSDAADEEQFYQDTAAAERVLKIVDLISAGLTVLFSLIAHTPQDRWHNRSKSRTE